LAIFGYDLATAFAVKSYRCVLGYDRFLVEFGLLLIRELDVFLSSVSDVGLTGSIAFKLARGLQETFVLLSNLTHSTESYQCFMPYFRYEVWMGKISQFSKGALFRVVAALSICFLILLCTETSVFAHGTTPVQDHCVFRELVSAFELYNYRTEHLKGVGFLAGQHGGKRIVVQGEIHTFGKRQYIQFHDMKKDFTTGGADGTQDLRVYPKILGEREANFFGYRQIDHKHVTVPDVNELNGAIAKFNQGLSSNDPRRIEISFYWTGEAFVSNREYIERFARYGQLPIARNGRQFYHDISAHGLAGLLTDNAVPTAIRNTSTLWLEFVKHCESLRLSSDELAQLKVVNDQVLKDLSWQIDQIGSSGQFLPRNSGLRGPTVFGSQSLSRLKAFQNGPEKYVLSMMSTIWQRLRFAKKSPLMNRWSSYVEQYRRQYPDAFRTTRVRADAFTQRLKRLRELQLLRNAESETLWSLKETKDFQLGPISPKLDAYKDANTAEFKMRNVLDGKNGGDRIVVQRTRKWNDPNRDQGGDIIPDLRLHQAALGEKEAGFFGYEYFNKDFVSVPNTRELNGAIDRFNNGLSTADPGRIRIRFYESPAEFGSNKTYVERFFEEGELPVSQKSRQFLHDINSHGLQGFYMNNEIIDNLALKYRMWKTFAEKYRAGLTSQKEIEAFEKVDDKVYYEITADIDRSSNLFFDLIPKNKREVLDAAHAQILNVSELPRESRIPKEGLLDWGTLLSSLSSSPRDFFLSRSLAVGVKISDPKVQSAFKAFLKPFAKDHPEMLKPLPLNLNKDLKDIQNAMSLTDSAARVQALRRIPLSRPFADRLTRLQQLKSVGP
jgi:hypothetical protein